MINPRIHEPLIYNIDNKQIYDVTDLDNTEIIDNYTIYPDYKWVNNILASHTTSHIGHNFCQECTILQHVLYYHFKNVNFATIGVNINGKLAHLTGSNCGFPEFNPKVHSLQVYKKVAIGFTYHGSFGHFINDMVCGLIALPSNITLDAEIFIKYDIADAKRFLGHLGFDSTRVHELTDDYIYAKDAYIACSKAGWNALQIAWADLRSIFYRRFNLDKIEPMQHSVYNKLEGTWGHVSNIDFLLNWSRTTYPQYNWILYDYWTSRNFTFLAKVVASSKILMIGAGSFVFNDIFLHKGCGCYIFGNTCNDQNVYFSGLTLQLYVVYVASPHFRWHLVQPSEFDVNLYKETIADLICAVYKGEWPKDVSKRFRIPFNSEEVYNKYIGMFNGTTNLQITRKKMIYY